MALSTLSTAKTRKELEDIIQKIPEHRCGVSMYTGSGLKTVTVDGVKALSAISRDGRIWSVQMDRALAAEMGQPLWKDMPYPL